MKAAAEPPKQDLFPIDDEVIAEVWGEQSTASVLS